MATAELRVGNVTYADTVLATLRGDKKGSLVIVGGGGNYQEAAYRGLMFSAANQGAGGTTTTVGLATAYTGLCLSNPISSAVNLVLTHVGVSVVGAPAALSTIGLLAGFHAATNVTHTTPLIAHNNRWDSTAGTNGTALVDSSATLPATPLLVQVFGTVPVTGATAQVVNPPFSGVSYDLNGSIVLAPGAFAAIYTSTVLSIIGSIHYLEIPA